MKHQNDGRNVETPSRFNPQSPIRNPQSAIPLREEARRRYLEDTEQRRGQVDRVMLRRSQLPAAILMVWFGAALSKWWYLFVHERKRSDVILVQAGLRRLGRWYEQVTSFLLAHSLLIVWTKAGRQLRRKCCNQCTYRKVDRMKIARCHGYGEGKTCDCPQVFWWYPSRLGYQIWLRAWDCPLGKFRWARSKRRNVETSKQETGKVAGNEAEWMRRGRKGGKAAQVAQDRRSEGGVTGKT